jgi:hypothetical protein
MGVNYDSLKPFLKEYLGKIEELFKQQESIQCQAIKSLRENTLTPVAVARELGCSRTTLYNHNQILKRYIECSAERIAEQNPLMEIENHAYKRKILEDQIALMEIRDINNEKLQHDCSVLTDLLKSKTAEIRRLQSRVMELTAELQGCRRSKI